MISALEYERLKERLERFEAWLGDRRSYKPEDVPEGLNVTNEERANLELYEWHTTLPLSYFAYWTGREYLKSPQDFDCAAVGTKVTNWTGRELGRVVRAGFVYRSNMGDKRRNITVQGNNGVMYSGTAYMTNGTYVRLRATKSQKKVAP